MTVYLRYFALIINFLLGCFQLYRIFIQTFIANGSGAAEEMVTFGVYLVVTLLSLVLFFPEMRLGLQKTSKKDIHEILSITVATLLCAAGLLLVFQLLGVSYVQDRAPIASVYAVVISVVLAPIYEEILCRGVILQLTLQWTKHPGISIVLSSVIYAMLHIDVGAQTLSLELINAAILLCLGLSCGISYYKTNNIVYPMGIHIFWNFFMVVPNIIIFLSKSLFI